MYKTVIMRYDVQGELCIIKEYKPQHFICNLTESSDRNRMISGDNDE